MNIFIISAGLTLVILGLMMTFHSSKTPDKIISTEEPDISKEPAISEEMVETTVPEPSLAERIQELWDTWEEQKQATEEYHWKNYKKYAAVIVFLMEKLDLEKVEVENELDENTIIVMTNKENGNTEIRIERRENN